MNHAKVNPGREGQLDPCAANRAAWDANVVRVRAMVAELSRYVDELAGPGAYVGFNEGDGGPDTAEEPPDAGVIVSVPRTKVSEEVLEKMEGLHGGHWRSGDADVVDIDYQVLPAENLESLKARIREDLERLMAETSKAQAPAKPGPAEALAGVPADTGTTGALQKELSKEIEARLGALLEKLIDDGLTMVQCREAFAKRRTPQELAYVEAAKRQSEEGSLEVDDDAEVSKGEDDGAYVGVWLWIPDAEAGLEPSEDVVGDD